MTKSKLTIILLGVIIGMAIGWASTMYFNFWKEPKITRLNTDNPELARIRVELDSLKGDLRERGIYNCCIQNDCDWCALQMGHCPCAELISKEGNEKSCPECAAAWNRKRGKIPGVDPDAVQVTTFGIYGFEKDGHHHGNAKHHKEDGRRTGEGYSREDYHDEPHSH